MRLLRPVVHPEAPGWPGRTQAQPRCWKATPCSSSGVRGSELGHGEQGRHAPVHTGRLGPVPGCKANSGAAAGRQDRPHTLPSVRGLLREEPRSFLEDSVPIKHQATGWRVPDSRWGRRWGAGLAGQREEEVGRPLPARPAPWSAPAAPALPDVLAVQLDVVGALLTEQRAPVSHD